MRVNVKKRVVVIFFIINIMLLTVGCAGFEKTMKGLALDDSGKVIEDYVCVEEIKSLLYEVSEAYGKQDIDEMGKVIEEIKKKTPVSQNGKSIKSSVLEFAKYIKEYVKGHEYTLMADSQAIVNDEDAKILLDEINNDIEDYNIELEKAEEEYRNMSEEFIENKIDLEKKNAELKKNIKHDVKKFIDTSINNIKEYINNLFQ